MRVVCDDFGEVMSRNTAKFSFPPFHMHPNSSLKRQQSACATIEGKSSIPKCWVEYVETFRCK